MFDFKEEFVLNLKKKDHASFNEFYLKTVDVFFRYIKTHFSVSDEDCHDIISTFYIKQWKALSKYNPSQSFSAYVWSIFKNTLKDYFKKQKDMPFSVLDDDDVKFEDQLMDDTDILDFLEKDFRIEQIQEALKSLDEMSSDIIYMKYIEGKDNSQIADILQISQENVRKRLSRAISSLKTLLS